MCNQQHCVVINHIASFALILLDHKEKTIIAIREFARQLRSRVVLTFFINKTTPSIIQKSLHQGPYSVNGTSSQLTLNFRRVFLPIARCNDLFQVRYNNVFVNYMSVVPLFTIFQVVRLQQLKKIKQQPSRLSLLQLLHFYLFNITHRLKQYIA